VDVDSITTRVTPRPYSQSAISSSDLVVVAKVRTSWRRLPGLVSCGTRTHATSIALPISNAATRPDQLGRLLDDLLHGDRLLRC